MRNQNRLQYNQFIITTSCLFAILALTFFVYYPGTNGIFVFDDIPNLSPMGKYADYSFWDRFWLFTLEGISGPTGRPLSLASFYLNDHSWPSQATGFIYTNILIHLLNGVLVFWLSHKLTATLGLRKLQQLGLSFIATSIWLLHPMQTTSVLYIIQRMTELSATFMLAGLIFYLSGREQLFKHQNLGFVTLFIGVGLSLILALISKENGILLVSYILVIEFFLLRPLKIKPPAKFNYWLLPAVILPFVAIIVYLVLHTNPDNFSNRNFTLTERLLTEPRIIFDYLHHIFIPNMGDVSLFHDDYIISKSLLSPWTTLPSIIGVMFLIFSAFAIRKTYPIISFSIAWFFAGHLIESTVLPLELYFEHRNYLPIFGIGFAIAWHAIKLIKIQRPITLAVISLFLSLNGFIVYQNATIWGKPLELITSWYSSHPQSERTRESYLTLTRSAGIKNNLLPLIHPPLENSNKSMFYSGTIMDELAYSCSKNKADKTMLDRTLNLLKSHIIHVSASTKTMEFLAYWKLGKCPNINTNDVETFLLDLASLKNMKPNGIFLHDIYFQLSLLSMNKKDFNLTMEYADKAYSYFPNIETFKLRIGLLISAGLYEAALKTLNDTSTLETSFRKILTMKIKQKELDQLKLLIQNKMQQAQTN